MTYLRWTVVVVALFPLASAVGAQNSKDHDPLFASHDTLEVEMEAPFLTLARERPDEDEVDGTFRYVTDEGSAVEYDIRVRTRGHFRRDKRICFFPPLRINFKKSQTKGTLFDKQDKLKLVTHCRSKVKRYDQSMVSEYLAYRIFNLLTDTSFRVRLLRVKYLYTDDDRAIENYAVLIEHKNRLGKRIGGEPLRIEKARVSALRRPDMNVASVFQFLLGNTDFSPVATTPDTDCCHNQALFSSDGGPYYTIPFDFDQTGFVDPAHASPNRRFGLKSVQDRLYRGRCINNDLLPETLQLFADRKGDIEALIRDQKELTPATRRRLQKYVESFFKVLDNPRRIRNSLVKRCI
ncbi:MAG: hypothetical protein V3S15_00570 [Woeseiaceae bacterium]